MNVLIEIYFTMNLFLHMNEIGQGSSLPGSQSLEDVTMGGCVKPNCERGYHIKSYMRSINWRGSGFRKKAKQ